ncbi:MAG: hypothetical protein ACE5GE_00010 [Phycisphaerae bacterium]
MFGMILAQLVGPAERLDAVQGHFMQRTMSDGMQVIYVTLIIAVVLCGVLLLVGRLDRGRHAREERAREQRRQQMARPSHLAAAKNRQFSLIGQKPPRQRTSL